MDLFLFHEVNQFALKWLWLDSLAIFFAQYFGYVLIFILILFLLRNFKKYRPILIQAFLAAIFARFIIIEIIHYFLPRARPFVENSINLLLSHSAVPSFPSGHAAFFFAISTVVFFYNKKAGTLFFLASFLISIFRVFVGIHWPLDILAGVIIGIFSGWIATLSFRKFSLTGKK